MNILYHYFLQKLLPLILNEGNINYGVLILFAFITATFLLLGLYLKKGRMKAAATLMNDAADSGADSFYYKDGRLICQATFKKPKKKKNVSKKVLKKVN